MITSEVNVLEFTLSVIILYFMSKFRNTNFCHKLTST